MISQFKEKYEIFIKESFKGYLQEWDYIKSHTDHVLKYAEKLAKLEKADLLVVELAALLHDSGRLFSEKGHNLESYKIARKFLKYINITGKQKDLILKCVLKHNSYFADENNEIEVKVIQSADGLSFVLDDDWQNYIREDIQKGEAKRLVEKMIKKINLKSAKSMAEIEIVRLKRTFHIA